MGFSIFFSFFSIVVFKSRRGIVYCTEDATKNSIGNHLPSMSLESFKARLDRALNNLV